MSFSPQDFFVILNAEIEDRMTQLSECGDTEYAPALEQEIEALHKLNADVVGQQPLSFSDYQWLCDLCAESVAASL